MPFADKELHMAFLKIIALYIGDFEGSASVSSLHTAVAVRCLWDNGIDKKAPRFKPP